MEVQNYSSNLTRITRAKPRKREPRKTVGITLPPKLIEEARKKGLNISRICEEALKSVLEYLPSQNPYEKHKKLLNGGSFPGTGSWAGSSAGMNARLALGRSRVQIPPGPLNFLSESLNMECSLISIGEYEGEVCLSA